VGTTARAASKKTIFIASYATTDRRGVKKPPRGRNAGKLRGKSYFVSLKNVIPAQAGIPLRSMFDEFHGT